MASPLPFGYLLGMLRILLCVLLVGCNVNRASDANALISCSRDGQCPADWSCNEYSARCVPDSARDELGPTPLAPAAGAQFPMGEVLLVWGGVTAAAEYTVEVSRSPDFSDGLFDATTPDTNITFDAMEPGAYHWRVRAHVTVLPPEELGTSSFVVYDDQIRVHCPVSTDCGEAAGPEAGTVEQPFRSIQRALAAAVSRGVTEIRVAEGRYVESITVASGKNVVGGYDPAFVGPPDAAAYPTEVNPGGLGEALIAQDILSPTLIQGLRLVGGGLGRSPVVRVTRNAGELTIDNCDLVTTREDDPRAVEIVSIGDSATAPMVQNSRLTCDSSNCVGVFSDNSGVRLVGNEIYLAVGNAPTFTAVQGQLIGGLVDVRDNQILIETTDPGDLWGMTLDVQSEGAHRVSGNRIHMRTSLDSFIMTGLTVLTSSIASRVAVERNDVRLQAVGANSATLGMVVTGAVDVLNNIVVVSGGERFNTALAASSEQDAVTRVVHNHLVADGNGTESSVLLGLAPYPVGVANNLLVNGNGTPAIAINAGFLMGSCGDSTEANPGSLQNNVFVGTFSSYYDDACAAVVTAPTFPDLASLHGAAVIWRGEAGTSVVGGNVASSSPLAELFVDPVGPDLNASDWLDADLHLLLTTDPDGIATSGLQTDGLACGPDVPTSAASPYDCGDVGTDFDGAPRVGAPSAGAFER